MDGTRIAVVIACFNADKTLARAIKSVSLLDTRLDIVVVDDCSTDDTRTVLLGDDINPSVKKIIFHETRQGPAAARNAALSWVATESYDYLTFLDADDHFLPTHITETLTTGEDLYIFESVETLDKYSRLSEYQDYVIAENKIESSNLREIISAYAQRPNRVPVFTTAWSRFFKVSVIKENDIWFNNRMETFEDVDFNFRFLKAQRSCRFVYSCLYAHTRPLRRSTTASFRPKKGLSGLFSFMWALRSMRAFTNSSMPDLTINYAGLYSAYFSISLIRAGRMVNSISSFFVFLRFTKRRLRSGYTQRAFACYNHREAGGRPVSCFLIKHKAALALCIYVLFVKFLEERKETSLWLEAH
jgi:glycosyltransferase involved in cell wall biosynthesis